MIKSVRPCAKAPDGNQLFTGGLHITGFIGAARLQRSLIAVPLPRQCKASQGLRKNRLVQARVLPILSVVGGNFNSGDAPPARPGQACDLVETWPQIVSDPRLAGLSRISLPARS